MAIIISLSKIYCAVSVVEWRLMQDKIWCREKKGPSDGIMVIITEN